MWTRKAVTYAGFGTILVLFAPFINNLQLLLLGITLLGFVAIHSLVNTRPVEVKITRRFSDSQLFEGQETEVDLVIQNRGRPIGCLEVYDQLPRELGPEKVANHTIVRLRRDEALLARYRLECHLRGQYTLGRPRLRLYNPSFLFYHESGASATGSRSNPSPRRSR